MATLNMWNSSYGIGFEGISNWANAFTDGWLSLAIIAMSWMVPVIVLMSKNDYKPSAAIGFGCFIALITAMILKLFMAVNEQVIFLLIVGLAVSVLLGLSSKHERG